MSSNRRTTFFGTLNSDFMPPSVSPFFSVSRRGSQGLGTSLYMAWNNIEMYIIGSVLNPESKPV